MEVGYVILLAKGAAAMFFIASIVGMRRMMRH